jgi:hypothetical protein
MILDNTIPEGTLEEFAKENKLTIAIGERCVAEGSKDRYYAYFHSCFVHSNNGPEQCGDGKTKEEAVRNFAKHISMGKLVHNGEFNERLINIWRLK